jgi:large subunit ribosomal protein L32e
MEIIKRRNKPQFHRQYSHIKLRTGGRDAPWRKPRGIDSLQRANVKTKGAHPRIGYSQPKAIRGKHPTGFVEVLVCCVKDVEKVGKGMVARIAGSVGARKRGMIEDAAKKKNIRVLNGGTQ